MSEDLYGCAVEASEKSARDIVKVCVEAFDAHDGQILPEHIELILSELALYFSGDDLERRMHMLSAATLLAAMEAGRFLDDRTLEAYGSRVR